MTTSSCFIVGLPAAGKTTFLAALWHSLQHVGKTKLFLKSYTGDHSYLSHIEEVWLSAEKVSRTSIDNQKKSISLLLQDNNGCEYNISFPDLSGEIFQKQYVDREIDKEIADEIIQSTALLLFINPETIIESLLISEIASDLRENILSDVNFAARNPTKVDPTDTQLVEILQFIADLKGTNNITMGVIVSAWDLIKEEKYPTPQEFIKERLPLLWQYLYSNRKIYNTLYFGISAQGSSLNSSDEIKKIISFDHQIKRITVVDDNGNKGNDITIPMWTMLRKGDT